MLSMLSQVQFALTRALDGEEGQGLTEYALILALIALIAMAALTLLGGSVTNELSTAASTV